MKLFLTLAFVAMAAAAPEPIRLPAPAQPAVAELNDVQVDPVRFVDAVQDAPVEEAQVDAVRFVDFAPEDTPAIDAGEIADAPEVAQVEDIQVDAVKIADAPAEVAKVEDIAVDAVRFVDSAPEDTPAIDAVKIADAPEVAQVEDVPVDAVRFVESAPEDTPAVNAVKIADPAQEIQVDAVRLVESPQPEVAEAIPAGHIFTPFELARGAQAIQSGDAIFVHAPLVQFVNIPQDEVNVDSPAQENIVKIADLPAPIELQAAQLPVVKDAQFDAVRFVDNPQVVVSPLEMQPILPIGADTIVVPQQIMDIILIAEKIMAEHQQQPQLGNVVVDPMLR